MSYYQSTYQSKVYRDFKEIDTVAYRKIIRFFEKREEAIGRLEFTEYFELLVCYVDALYEVGAHQKHLRMIDTVIEHSIAHNIHFYKGLDIYSTMLLKKAVSHYHLLQHKEAEYILKELIKMDPEDNEVVSFLKKCLRRKSSKLVSVARASSIFIFLLTAFLISMEVLLIRPFYKMYAPLIENSRITLFIIGLVILVGADLLHRIFVEQTVREFVKNTKKSKGSQS